MLSVDVDNLVIPQGLPFSQWIKSLYSFDLVNIKSITGF